jgi:LacI family transcriptional regulator
MINIVLVAEHAGVSVATVSRVLNNFTAVRPDTRARVLASMKTLNFRPNGAARALGSGRSFGVGVMVGDLGSPFFGQILKSIEREIRSEGLHMLVSNGGFTTELEAAAYNFLCERRSEALIMYVDRSSDDQLMQWAQQGVPLVIIGRNVPQLKGQCVYLDNRRGGFLATQYLIDRGHRQIAHISGPLQVGHYQDSLLRLQGYRQALEENGLAYVESAVIESDYSERGGYEAAHELLRRGGDSTAIFVGNDQMAAGAMQQLRDSGVNVPGDISIVGYDDLLNSRYLNPQLTTVHQPLEEMGRAAALLALKAAGMYTKSVQYRFEPELVVRQSVRAL